MPAARSAVRAASTFRAPMFTPPCSSSVRNMLAPPTSRATYGPGAPASVIAATSAGTAVPGKRAGESCTRDSAASGSSTWARPATRARPSHSAIATQEPSAIVTSVRSPVATASAPMPTRISAASAPGGAAASLTGGGRCARAR